MLSDFQIILINSAIILAAFAFAHLDTSVVSPSILSILPYLVMKALALLCVLFGARQSEVFRRKTADDIEHLTSDEARKGPIIGSAILLSLFWSLKLISPQTINKILSVYFALSGTFAINSAALGIIGKSPNMVVGTLSIIIAWYHFLFPHWIANNLVGLAMAVTALTRTHIKDTKTALLFLWLLFFYDIWWVFGTTVMIDVALQIKGPIKIIVPKFSSEASGYTYALLGLGDIVVPGLFVALMYRYDRHYDHTIEGTAFFIASILGYAIGLILAFACGQYFQAAQPALLYLVPSVTGASALYAAWISGFTDWWKFAEPVQDDFEKPEESVTEKEGWISWITTSTTDLVGSGLKELFGIH